eukprot:CAMPEP_0173111306 /NCGR_PEP_ID=MMETSP1102-20130122/45077_1 /TAXON_ID=49646 /ORGANISM="Geminigera sp., Strain Caron Lab Isolate" /LENGTH=334 /DNA_ID=CAMNT_0014011627 /DNA_START=99 /DNA_END=1103 /DNA_ORIENTATION=-
MAPMFVRLGKQYVVLFTALMLGTVYRLGTEYHLQRVQMAHVHEQLRPLHQSLSVQASTRQNALIASPNGTIVYVSNTTRRPLDVVLDTRPVGRVQTRKWKSVHEATTRSLQSNRTGQNGTKTGTLYAIVTLPKYANANSERWENVVSITTRWPEITIFPASHYLDPSCLNVLGRLNIQVSPSYKSDEKGRGWVHAGKIGHWCSFLRYIAHCDASNFEFCVWLEDDIVMTHNLMTTIKNYTQDYGTPLVALGKGDEANVIVGRHAAQLLKHFTDYTIVGPLDVVPDNSFLRISLYLFDARRYHAKENSTLVCATCPLLTVSEVNGRIQRTRAATK